MKQVKQFIVTVKGCGYFPIDMLRYDRATPRNESDSSEIGRYLEDRQVTVQMDHEPNKDRWKSFGWPVIDIRTEYVAKSRFKKQFTVIVEGFGPFFHDMLRYDRATPKSQLDSEQVDRDGVRRCVTVIMYQPPTVDRWESRSWNVLRVLESPC